MHLVLRGSSDIAHGSVVVFVKEVVMNGLDFIALIYLIFGGGIFRFFAILLGGMLLAIAVGLNGIPLNSVTFGCGVVVVLLVLRAVRSNHG